MYTFVYQPVWIPPPCLFLKTKKEMRNSKWPGICRPHFFLYELGGHLALEFDFFINFVMGPSRFYERYCTSIGRFKAVRFVWAGHPSRTSYFIVLDVKMSSPIKMSKLVLRLASENERQMDVEIKKILLREKRFFPCLYQTLPLSHLNLPL